jgi:hypothetical protein
METEGTNDANIQPSPPVGLRACLLREAKEGPLIIATVAALRAWRVAHTVAAKSNANALFSLQRHEQERSQPAQLSV